MKTFKCDVCTKSFKYQSLYERHKGVHNSQKNFKCEICGKGFNRSDTLKTHMNIHSQTGYACCDRFFHSKAALNYHKKAIHSIKSLNCKNCDKLFLSKQDLQNHLQTHEVTQFPMLLDCISTQESNFEIQPSDKLIYVVEDQLKKHSIWSEADLLLSFLKV